MKFKLQTGLEPPLLDSCLAIQINVRFAHRQQRSVENETFVVAGGVAAAWGSIPRDPIPFQSAVANRHNAMVRRRVLMP
jgi:hypothetical protein